MGYICDFTHEVIELNVDKFLSLNALLCSKLDKAVNEGTSAAAGCEVQEGEITLKVEANQELVAAMKKCDLTLTFEAGEILCTELVRVLSG